MINDYRNGCPYWQEGEPCAYHPGHTDCEKLRCIPIRKSNSGAETLIEAFEIKTNLEREFGFKIDMRVPCIEYVLWLEEQLRKARQPHGEEPEGVTVTP
jgi:hypothetical protein